MCVREREREREKERERERERKRGEGEMEGGKLKNALQQTAEDRYQFITDTDTATGSECCTRIDDNPVNCTSSSTETGCWRKSDGMRCQALMHIGRHEMDTSASINVMKKI